MNIYFLVEGKRTEMKVYPEWLSILAPELIRVKSFDEVDKNNYYIFSGEGFPSLLHNHLINSIEDVNSTGKYDYFVICLDSDDESIENRKNQVLDFISDNQLELINTGLKIIIQNKCIETWFL